MALHALLIEEVSTDLEVNPEVGPQGNLEVGPQGDLDPVQEDPGVDLDPVQGPQQSWGAGLRSAGAINAERWGTSTRVTCTDPLGV